MVASFAFMPANCTLYSPAPACHGPPCPLPPATVCREELYFFIDEDYDAYVHRMQQPHTWGGARALR